MGLFQRKKGRKRAQNPQLVLKLVFRSCSETFDRLFPRSEELILSNFVRIIFEAICHFKLLNLYFLKKKS